MQFFTHDLQQLFMVFAQSPSRDSASLIFPLLPNSVLAASLASTRLLSRSYSPVSATFKFMFSLRSLQEGWHPSAGFNAKESKKPTGNFFA